MSAFRRSASRTRAASERDVSARDRDARPGASSRAMKHGVTDLRAHLERGRRWFARHGRRARHRREATITTRARRNKPSTRDDRNTVPLRARLRHSRYARNAFAQSRRNACDARDSNAQRNPKASRQRRTKRNARDTQPRRKAPHDMATREEGGACVSTFRRSGLARSRRVKAQGLRAHDRGSNHNATRATLVQRETRASRIHEKADPPKASRPRRAFVVRVARRRHPRREAREPSPRLATMTHEASAR